MKTVTIGELEANALRVLSEVAEYREPVVVTKQGVPLAQITPYLGAGDRPIAGKLSETLLLEDDIESPVGDTDWDAVSGK